MKPEMKSQLIKNKTLAVVMKFCSKEETRIWGYNIKYHDVRLAVTFYMYNTCCINN